MVRNTLLSVLAVCMVCAALAFTAPKAEASDLSLDVAAMRSVPSAGIGHVALETGAFHNRVTEDNLFTVGLAGRLGGFGVGGAVAYDNTGDNQHKFAGAVTIPLTELGIESHAKLTVFTVPDFDAEGLDMVGTVGAVLRAEF